LAPPLLHLGLSLARLWLWHSCGILIAASHARIRAPGCVSTVGGDDGPQQPGVVAHNGGHDDAAIAPVYNIPHVLGQALRIEVLTRALHGAVGSERGAGEALEVELDEQLRGREEQVEDDGRAGERGAEDEGAQEPPEQVDGEGDAERLVEARRVGGRERLGGFLRRV
jgi:hypothetical protein